MARLATELPVARVWRRFEPALATGAVLQEVAASREP
jgi:hypothetical protein